MHHNKNWGQGTRRKGRSRNDSLSSHVKNKGAILSYFTVPLPAPFCPLSIPLSLPLAIFTTYCISPFRLQLAVWLL